MGTDDGLEDQLAQVIRDANGTPEALAAWTARPQLIPAHVYARAVLDSGLVVPSIWSSRQSGIRNVAARRRRQWPRSAHEKLAKIRYLHEPTMLSYLRLREVYIDTKSIVDEES